MNKERNSNVELLRIIAMVFIMLWHYVLHSGVARSALPLGPNRFLLEIATLGHIGVIIYTMISGYFLITSKEVKLKKIMKLWTAISFYSLFFLVIFALFGDGRIGLRDILHNLMPVTFKLYWFCTAYLIIYLFHPFLNRLLNGLSRKRFLLLLALMTFLFAVMPTLFKQDYYGEPMGQMLLFYGLGAYLRKYPENYFSRNRRNVKYLVLTTLILVISAPLLDLFAVKAGNSGPWGTLARIFCGLGGGYTFLTVIQSWQSCFRCRCSAFL